ncbi:hypothetical protein DRP04_04715 [Archaeoglobales archaeon]|nr:MAG: hypothetical protein DRP04_04715 [Archaeoglobales archaeon]
MVLRQKLKVVAIVATLVVTTIISLHAVMVGLDTNFPPTVAAGAMLLALTLYWLWRTVDSWEELFND